MSKSITTYSLPTATLTDVKNGQLDAEIRNKGMSVEKYFELILLNGCPHRFKKILEDECMTELKDILKEQAESMDNLTKAWSESFKGLKTTVEDRKQFVKKSGGDIKDSIEKLRQSMDKFLTVINEEKLSLICQHVSIITECVIKINDLEKTGALQKLAYLINNDKNT